jgi:alkylated DNA nucleotide flippase Atl1/ketosteroid isomerase-like protein
LKLDRVARSNHESRIAGIVARIRQIPKGSVRTYGEIDPEAPRLVGRVLATTQEKLPWQRVIRADGSIPKGQRQRALLLGEGVPMRGERVDLVRARLNLPDAVSAYMRAAEVRDADAVVACFGENAQVTDEGRTWRGRAEIRRWWEGPATKYRYTVKVRGGQRVASDRYLARVRLTGTFPGRTVDLRYRFTLRDALISALEIAP